MMAATSEPVAPDAWAPLRREVFRSLWFGALASNVGLWVQNAAGSWDMTSFGTAPVYVALLQTASSLPVFLIGLPAAAFGDIFDRRRLLASFAAWMVLVSALLAALSFAGLLGPTSLLALTFALGLGSALSAPLWQAILPSLVDKAELASAVTLSGVAVNVARALGPAIGGIGLALAGSGPVYTFNALAFFVVVLQVLRWKPPATKATLPPERVVGAIVAGLRYARRAPALRAVLFRAAAFIVAGSALWALLPVVARRELHMTPLRFGILLGCIGAGALAGAAVMPRARQKLGSDGLVAIATVAYAGSMSLLAHVRIEALLYAAMLATGVAWISIMSSFNVAASSAAPGWVQSRALGLYLLVFQGGLGLGSFGWGTLAGRIGSAATLSVAAACVLLGLLSALRWKLGAARKDDVASFDAWPEPVIEAPIDIDAGPVLVERRYVVRPEHRVEFLSLAAELESLRRRDGAIDWALYEDLGSKDRLVETFLVASWAEHLRQHRRAVAADRALLDRMRALSEDAGVVHLVDARSAAAARARGLEIADRAHPEEP
ncbi:MFS transporter [Polyangium sorediatum]|uniref:MFS transporter n=1 Tax=Polyangium sorediatum TaxID=889274 RepID=A0ABT6P5H1_9BACT|nr:MFS transporter [Polyangium sorediatum]MDI1435557.1 MFS transporter [Polyangium sorediatum]